MKNQQLLYALGAMLVVSLIGNIYLWNRNRNIIVPIEVSSQVATSTSITLQSPYGYKSEVVTILDNGQLKTYATTSAITKNDIEQMHKRAIERIKAMDDYFREQNEFFRRFWSDF